jgi:hypothetical protein
MMGENGGRLEIRPSQPREQTAGTTASPGLPHNSPFARRTGSLPPWSNRCPD